MEYRKKMDELEWNVPWQQLAWLAVVLEAGEDLLPRLLPVREAALIRRSADHDVLVVGGQSEGTHGD